MEERANEYFKTIERLWDNAEKEVQTYAQYESFQAFKQIYHPNDAFVRDPFMQSYTSFWRGDQATFPNLNALEQQLASFTYYNDQRQQIKEHNGRALHKDRAHSLPTEPEALLEPHKEDAKTPPIGPKAQGIVHTVLDTTAPRLLLGKDFRVLSTPLATADSGKTKYTPVASGVTLMATPLQIGTATHFESKGKGLTIKLVALLNIYFPDIDASDIISTDKDPLQRLLKDKPRVTPTAIRASKRTASNADTRLIITSPNTKQYLLERFKGKTPKMKQAYDAGWVLNINKTKVTLPTVLTATYTKDDFLQACEETTEKQLCKLSAAWWYRINSPLPINTEESPAVLERWLVNSGKDTEAENQVYQLLTSLELLDNGNEQYRVAFRLPSLKLSAKEDKLSRELQQLIEWAHKRKKNITELDVELLWTYDWTDIPKEEKTSVTHSRTLAEGLGYSTEHPDGVVKGMRAHIHTDCSKYNSTWTVYFCGSPMYTIFYKNKKLGCALKWHTSCPDWVLTNTFSYYFGPVKRGEPAGSYPLKRSKKAWVDGEDGISGLQFANSPLTTEECATLAAGQKDALKHSIEKKQYIGFTSIRGTKYLGKPLKSVRGKELKIAYDWVAVSKNDANATLAVKPSRIKETCYDAIAETPSFDDLKNPINWQIRKDVGKRKDPAPKQPAVKKIRVVQLAQELVEAQLKVDKTANCWVYDSRLKTVQATLGSSTQNGRSTLVTCTFPQKASLTTGRRQRSMRQRNVNLLSLAVVDHSKKPPNFIMRQTGIGGLRCLIHCIQKYLKTEPTSYKIPEELKGKKPEQVADALIKRLSLQLEDASSIEQIETLYALDEASNVTRLQQNLAQGMTEEKAKEEQLDIYTGMQNEVTTELECIQTHKPLTFTSQMALADMYGIQLVTHVVGTLDDELNREPGDSEVSVALITDDDGEDVRVKIIKRMQTTDAEFVCHLLNVEYGETLTASTNCDHFNFLEACTPLPTGGFDSGIPPPRFRAEETKGDYVKPTGGKGTFRDLTFPP